MFEGRSEEVVRDISNVKQEIISYRKIIKPERSTLRLLERHVERFLPEELELYFDDIVDAAERIWDILDNYKEVVEALEDTNESVISHRQNDVLRVLTVFSVVLLPLTLITGIFGMNVRFPGFDTVWAFWAIFVAMVVDAGRACSRSSGYKRMPLSAEAAVGAVAPRVRRACRRARPLHLLRPGAGAARARDRARARRDEQVPVRVGPSAGRAAPARRRVRRAHRRRGARGARARRARRRRAAARSTRRRGSTSAGTSAASAGAGHRRPRAPARRARAGTATRASCRCSAT